MKRVNNERNENRVDSDVMSYLFVKLMLYIKVNNFSVMSAFPGLNKY